MLPQSASSQGRWFGTINLTWVATFALGLVGAMSPARADTAPICTESGLPIETLGSDKEQREALYQQATACVREGKPLQAVALLSQIIKSDPTAAVAYLNRGSAQASAGEVALALNDFSVAINLQPDLVVAWYNRGTTFTHIRRFESAIADFTEAIRLKPDFALAYCNRGLANLQLGHYDEALVDYVVAIDRDPKLTYCYFNRGNLYLTLGEYQKWISDFTAALGERRGNPLALTRRAQAYEAIGQKLRRSTISAPRWRPIPSSRARAKALTASSPSNSNRRVKSRCPLCGPIPASNYVPERTFEIEAGRAHSAAECKWV